MKQLNQKQRQILDKWFTQNYGEVDILDSQDIDAITMERIEEANNYESLYTDIDRYVSDLVFKEVYG